MNAIWNGLTLGFIARFYPQKLHLSSILTDNRCPKVTGITLTTNLILNMRWLMPPFWYSMVTILAGRVLSQHPSASRSISLASPLSGARLFPILNPFG